MVDPAPERVNEGDRSEPDAEAELAAILIALGYQSGGLRVCRRAPLARLRERRQGLGLGAADYQSLLRASAAERAIARRAIASVSTRLWRDPALWAQLRDAVLPALGSAHPEARLWVAEAGAGLEAYTLSLLWGEVPSLRRRPVRILSTDSREDRLEQARAGRVPDRALRGMPEGLRARLLPDSDGHWRLAPDALTRVVVATHDLARDPWPFEIDVLLLRHSVFRLWGEAMRVEAVARASDCLVSHGWLALGRNERLEGAELDRFEPFGDDIPLYRKRS